MEINKDRVFIVAELSANHNGSKQLAIDSIKAIKECGADAVKFQTYTADTITLKCDKDDFKIKGTIWENKYLYDLYKEAYTPWEWHEELFDVARKEGLICFSTPFDFTSVDFLESIGNPIYKIASFEITDIPLIEYAASKGKPMILSTGIAKEEDIELALETCYKAGNRDITLLKCTSSYPAPIEDSNLIMIKDMSEKYKVKTGLSDHTMGFIAPVAATCLGATIIEKHFILDRKAGGPDASFSMEKDEFAEMVKLVRLAEKSIGKVDYTLSKEQISSRSFSRSLYAVKNIKKGDNITLENVKSIRPGYGLHPKHLNEILGKVAVKDIEIGDPIDFSDIQL